MDKIVDITGIAYGGKGVGRIDGKIVFVPFTAPGDKVRVNILTEKKAFSEGVVTEILSPSPLRQTPPCGLFGICGGCSLQHINYKGQLEWKENIFEETLKRIGKISDVDYLNPVPSEAILNYRSRASFHIEGGRWGFYEGKSHRVVDIESCPILDEGINAVFGRLKKALSNADAGLCGVDIGVSMDGGDGDGGAVALLRTYKDTGFKWGRSLSGVEGLKGFEVWRQELKKGKGKRIIAEGDISISYRVRGLDLSAGISVFSQVNPYQNKNLVDKVVEFAGLKGDEKVVDLFSGAGNLTLPLAPLAREAVGIESNAEAIDSAFRNASRNGSKRVEFQASDAFGWLKRNIKTLERERPSVLVLDPPRSGEYQVATALSGFKPEKIVYVSCSPPTLARDLSLLTGCGYRVSKAQLIDMFPQTYHIEGVAALELR
ncbi:MAG: 23S rRNA (uracil(1939)-C(5))-methyltransferase RlmD [Deltaproteobacteria bacterium]|nr:23S rRNA (uracil(1939)-C(5))-methyltransferase RlmD [Deltaproteobacteria bacterium]